MICDKLLDIVLSNYVHDGERLIGHKFFRQLNSRTQTYYYYLKIVVEREDFGLCIDRTILLGTSLR